jgi:hypothetical protein
VNVFFEAYYSPRARWTLERLPADAVAAIDQCVGILERDPYADSPHIGTLAIPGEPRFHPAYHCGEWGIAYHVEDNVFLSVDVIARWWPPAGPFLPPSR